MNCPAEHCQADITNMVDALLAPYRGRDDINPNTALLTLCMDCASTLLVQPAWGADSIHVVTRAELERVPELILHEVASTKAKIMVQHMIGEFLRRDELRPPRPDPGLN